MVRFVPMLSLVLVGCTITSKARYTFVDQPLGTVAETMNQANPAIRIELSPRLARNKVSGSLYVGKPDALVDLLRGFGYSVTIREERGITIYTFRKSR